MVRLNRTPFSHLKIYGLTVHIIQNFSIFQKRPIKSKFQQIMQIPRSSPTQSANYVKLAHFVKLILYYVSGTCPRREPWKIPVNYADSAQFAHTVRELREIRTIY